MNVLNNFHTPCSSVSRIYQKSTTLQCTVQNQLVEKYLLFMLAEIYFIYHLFKYSNRDFSITASMLDPNDQLFWNWIYLVRWTCGVDKLNSICSSGFILKIFSIIIFTINFVSGTWELLLQLKATWRHSIVSRVLQFWHWYRYQILYVKWIHNIWRKLTLSRFLMC